MTITKEDIDQLDYWLHAYCESKLRHIDNSNCTDSSYYKQEYDKVYEESDKMSSLIDKLRDHFGVK